MNFAASNQAESLTPALLDRVRQRSVTAARPRTVYLASPAQLFLVAVGLMCFGVVMIASATMSLDRPLLGAHFWNTPAGRQVCFVAAGILLMYGTMRLGIIALDWPRARRWAPPALFASAVLLLVAVLIPGVADPHRGSSRWLHFSPLGFGFQPSELGKLALVCMLAWLLGERGTDARSFLRAFAPSALVTGLCVGLVGAENLGTAALLAAVAGCMLAVGGCHVLHLMLMVSAGTSGLIGLLFAAPYRMERITAFRDIWADPLGKGYQPIQSLTSIAAGGWLGVGLGSGLQKYGYLPESHTDFIFAIICEETGLVGGGLVIALFCALAWLGMRVTLAAPNAFERLLAFGLTAVICMQAAINIAVVTVTMPTTGVPLPMISAGGSGLLTVSMALGLLAAIAERSRRAHGQEAAD